MVDVKHVSQKSLTEIKKLTKNSAQIYTDRIEEIAKKIIKSIKLNELLNVKCKFNKINVYTHIKQQELAM